MYEQRTAISNAWWYYALRFYYYPITHHIEINDFGALESLILKINQVMSVVVWIICCPYFPVSLFSKFIMTVCICKCVLFRKKFIALWIMLASKQLLKITVHELLYCWIEVYKVVLDST